MNVLSKLIINDELNDHFQQCIYFTKLLVIRRLLGDVIHSIKIAKPGFYNKYIKKNLLFKDIVSDINNKYINKRSDFYSKTTAPRALYIFLLEEFYYNWTSVLRKSEMNIIYEQIIIIDKYFEMYDEYYLFVSNVCISDRIILIIRSKTSDIIKFQCLYTFMTLLPFIANDSKNIDTYVSYFFENYVHDDIADTDYNYNINIKYLHICYNKILCNIKAYVNDYKDLSFIDPTPSDFKFDLLLFIFNYFILFVVCSRYVLKKINKTIHVKYDELTKHINASKNNLKVNAFIIKQQYSLLYSNHD